VRNFWTSEILQVTALAAIAYGAGLTVQLGNGLYLIPLLIDRFFPFERSVTTATVRALLSAAMLVALWQPIRTRVPVFQTMFTSFDRPEDRPHTLLWLSSQIVAGYAVLIPMAAVFGRYGMSELVFIPVVIHGVGDGLAEPVGIRFGRHQYSTRMSCPSTTASAWASS